MSNIVFLSRVHVLKIWPEPYNALLDGRKTAEFRRDDRGGFSVGDILMLQPYEPGRGHVNLPAIRANISHVAGAPHVPEGYVMLSLQGVRTATLDEDNAAMNEPGAYGLGGCRLCHGKGCASCPSAVKGRDA